MTVRSVLFSWFIVLSSLSCSEAPPPVGFKRLALFEMHVFHGGTIYFLSGDGTVWARHLQPPRDKEGRLHEIRSQGALSAQQLMELGGLFGKHATRQEGSASRPRVVDSAGVALSLDWLDDSQLRWSGEDLDLPSSLAPVVGWLRRNFAEARLEKIYEGAQQPDWSPPGFQEKALK